MTVLAESNQIIGIVVWGRRSPAMPINMMCDKTGMLSAKLTGVVIALYRQGLRAIKALGHVFAVLLIKALCATYLATRGIYGILSAILADALGLSLGVQLFEGSIVNAATSAPFLMTLLAGWLAWARGPFATTDTKSGSAESLAPRGNLRRSLGKMLWRFGGLVRLIAIAMAMIAFVKTLSTAILASLCRNGILAAFDANALGASGIMPFLFVSALLLSSFCYHGNLLPGVYHRIGGNASAMHR